MAPWLGSKGPGFDPGRLKAIILFQRIDSIVIPRRGKKKAATR
ncbi:hypothetical protein MICA_1681 [Micavibrio aeruginosavorus ARL-13]|uniref:Uncharacterized protein n=2 Tax=Micavibrio aeruginosavorus TaxID=349221 RepID=G2KQR6_MICAA|nr:hypothetical protein MICA_1681 [Micavibrio aeruginosavorus ARL-13]AGH98406.1 hypothetical protein A11S_1602 [Micavibrio aeruginosavorus EPB]